VETEDMCAWIDIRLVDYVGEDLVLAWANSDNEYKDITDFIIDFGIDDSTLNTLVSQYELYDIYDINEIQSELAVAR
jgi:hypothetical protein